MSYIYFSEYCRHNASIFYSDGQKKKKQGVCDLILILKAGIQPVIFSCLRRLESLI